MCSHWCGPARRCRVVGCPSTPTQRSLSAGASMIPSTARAPCGECNQRTKQRKAADKALGAVDRIEHPGELRACLGGELFALDAVRRKLGTDHAAHFGLDGAIGDGDRTAIRLLFHGDGRAKVAARDAARRIGELIRERERARAVTVPGIAHALQYNQPRQNPGTSGMRDQVSSDALARRSRGFGRDLNRRADARVRDASAVPRPRHG